ncbi:nucleoside deaminase [Actinacidiphila oryziradicis]|uniref:nucleoside deaminase n=1 Tax=Actinacidiphila oryziradicis TaxID=2571141 RepID=UPI0023F3C35D|nr:nucleoside deaminase [Actinacidiphila oryziradicis]MCW2874828.1 cytidine deaminase [Actinacidiphila oryziradicis]
MTITSTATDPFLQAAFEEAVAGYNAGGLPIGSVLVRDGEIIGRGHNRRVQDGNPILHAEMSCFQNAGRLPSSVYRECTIYSTLSPCYMCSGAMLLFGVPRVVVGESRTVEAADDFLRSQGLDVTVLDDPGCYELMQRFTREQPEIWAEDVGDAGVSRHGVVIPTLGG